MKSLGILSAAFLLLPAAAQAETLSAEQALGRAALQSPTLRAALLDVASARQGVLAEQGARDPVFVASATGSYTESAGLIGGDVDDVKALETTAALRYTTDAGTTLEVGTSGDVSWSSQNAALELGPRYSALGYVSARQPLLQGAGKDAQLAGQRSAEANATAAELTRDAAASQLALDVITAYWELWYAEQAVLVQQKALETARKQLADAQIRESQLGTASKADVLQFLSNVASIQDVLSQAVTTQKTRSLDLGRLLGMDALHASTLTASGELPALGPAAPSGALYDMALSSSPELGALRAELGARRVQLAAAEDADQPRLDVFARASAGVLWGDVSGGGSVQLAGGRPAYSVIGGLELELPIGGGRAEAEATRSRLELDAAGARYQERWLAVTSQVGSLRETVEAARVQNELAAESARVARELAEAERQRLLLGTTTPSDVVLAEQSLRAAELRELRVRVSRVVSQYQLDHVTGALLGRLGAAFPVRKS